MKVWWLRLQQKRFLFAIGHKPDDHFLFERQRRLPFSRWRRHLGGWSASPERVSSHVSSEKGEYQSDLEPADRLSQCLLRSLESVRVTQRVCVSVCHLVPLLPLAPALLLPTSLAGAPELQSLVFKWTAFVVASWGPTSVKFLQWAATRNDLFPEQFCRVMQQYQARVPPDPFPYACLLYAASLQRSRQQRGFIEPGCIGSGSVAQVYNTLGSHTTDTHSVGRFQTVDTQSNQSTDTQSLESTDTHGCPIEHLFHQNVCKILRPFVQRQVRNDLFWARVGCKALCLFPGEWKTWIPLQRSLDNFERLILPQTNLKQEAVNLDAFGVNFARSSSRRLLRRAGGIVRFPVVDKGSCTEEVLVEAKEEGVPFDSWMRIKSEGEDLHLAPTAVSGFLRRAVSAGWTARRTRLLTKRPTILLDASSDQETRELGRKVARLGANMFLQMLIFDNFVHTDLHPGNILLRYCSNRRPPTGTQRLATSSIAGKIDRWKSSLWWPWKSSQMLELVILDAGLTSRLEGRDRDNFIDLFRAIAFGDGYRAGHLMLTRARRHACDDAEGFCSSVAAIVKKFVGPPISFWDLRLTSARHRFTMQNLHIGDVLHNILSCTLRYKVELDPSFVGIILATTILEGVGKGLDPDLDLLQVARPFLQTLMYQRKSS